MNLIDLFTQRRRRPQPIAAPGEPSIALLPLVVIGPQGLPPHLTHGVTAMSEPRPVTNNGTAHHNTDARPASATANAAGTSRPAEKTQISTSALFIATVSAVTQGAYTGLLTTGGGGIDVDQVARAAIAQADAVVRACVTLCDTGKPPADGADPEPRQWPEHPECTCGRCAELDAQMKSDVDLVIGFALAQQTKFETVADKRRFLRSLGRVFTHLAAARPDDEAKAAAA